MKAIETERDKLLANHEEIRRVLDTMTVIFPELARARMAAYQEHLAAGFTEPQALELCKKLTI